MKLLIQSLFIFSLVGCASTQQWTPAGGNRDEGVVRVSYEYPEFQQPQMSESQAQKLALSRCNAWGYQKAEPIAGQIRQCANMDDGNCDLWSVTREFQCKEGEGSYVSRLSR
jgi:YecR-like lipoprotein